MKKRDEPANVPLTGLIPADILVSMKRRIALIEDDEVISGNYADFLAALGFEVDAYLTKENALRGLEASR